MKIAATSKHLVLRLIALIEAVVLCLLMFSCANNENEDDTDTPDVFKSRAEVVNKGGATAVVTYVIDDGAKATADFAKTMLSKYSLLNLTFAVETKDLATLKTQASPDGKTEYVMQDGKYVYDVNNANYEYWKSILDLGRTEIVSHTHTHSFWGTNDDGGVFEYVDNAGQLHTSSELPVGSTKKEIYASKQILQDLFPSSLYPSQKAISMVEPGIGVKTSSATVGDKTVISYKPYYDQLMKTAVMQGDYIGSRSTFQAKTGFEDYVNTKNYLKSIDNRMKVNAFMIVDANAGENIAYWKNYIDTAVDKGGWACFCIHNISAQPMSGHYILESQADELFAYTQSIGRDIWIANFTEAMLYYCEWSTSKVTSSFSDNKITVTLTDGESRNDIYNIPLTVKVTVPDTWTSVTVGGETLSTLNDSDGNRYVYIDIVPDSGAVEIVSAS